MKAHFLISHIGGRSVLKFEAPSSSDADSDEHDHDLPQLRGNTMHNAPYHTTLCYTRPRSNVCVRARVCVCVCE